MRTKYALITGIVVNMLIASACSQGTTIRNAQVKLSVLGNSIEFGAEEIVIGGAEPRPPGLEFKCFGEIDGNSFTLFCNTEDDSQWIKDEDGDYHPVNSEHELECPPVRTPARLDLVELTQNVQFSFDEKLDYATARFVYPVEMLHLYVPPSDMPLNTTQNGVQLDNGDLVIEYTGTINDVLGAMWILGFTEISFKDPLAGMVRVGWSSEINAVRIDTSIESRTEFIQWTNPSNLND